MDNPDTKLLNLLKRDGRASISELANILGTTRTTVRSRLERLKKSGEIVGFSVVTRHDVSPTQVRGLMMLGIEGRGTERLMAVISTMPQVMAVHSTNGSWDLIAEIGTETLEDLDEVLFAIRRLDGVIRSETNLLLSTRKGRI